MAIVTSEDPRTGETITIIKGVIQQLSIHAIDPPDKYENTHNIGLKIDDEWINYISVKTKEGYEPNLRINTGTKTEPKYVKIEAGDDVRVEVKVRQVNGKTYYNSSVGKIRLVKKGEGSPQQQNNTQGSTNTNNTGSKQQYQKKDDTGMFVGHAIKGASALLDRFKGDIVEHGKFVHDTTRKVQKEYQARSGLNDYESGNAAGNAVLLACQYASGIDKIEAYANRLLDNVVPALTTYIRGEPSKASVSASEQSSPAPSTNVGGNQENSSQSDGEGFDAFDDFPPF